MIGIVVVFSQPNSSLNAYIKKGIDPGVGKRAVKY